MSLYILGWLHVGCISDCVALTALQTAGCGFFSFALHIHPTPTKGKHRLLVAISFAIRMNAHGVSLGVDPDTRCPPHQHLPNKLGDLAPLRFGTRPDSDAIGVGVGAFTSQHTIRVGGNAWTSTFGEHRAKLSTTFSVAAPTEGGAGPGVLRVYTRHATDSDRIEIGLWGFNALDLQRQSFQVAHSAPATSLDSGAGGTAAPHASVTSQLGAAAGAGAAAIAAAARRGGQSKSEYDHSGSALSEYLVGGVFPHVSYVLTLHYIMPNTAYRWPQPACVQFDFVVSWQPFESTVSEAAHPEGQAVAVPHSASIPTEAAIAGLGRAHPLLVHKKHACVEPVKLPFPMPDRFELGIV